MLIGFNSCEAAGQCVAAIIGSGIIPVAIEYMDKPAIAVCEAFAKAGYPLDVEALLIVEVEGFEDEIAGLLRDIVEIARALRSKVVEVEHFAPSRARASGRGARPRSAPWAASPTTTAWTAPSRSARLPEVLGQIAQICAAHRLKVANVFHAGDGNLHPLILYNANDADEARRAELAGAEILKLCVAVGGCLTGEHGVGIEKRDLMEVQFSPSDLAVQMRIKSVFDPLWLLNPGKVFPLSCARSRPSARPRTRRPEETQLSDLQRPGADWELQFVIAGCAERRLPIEIVGSGSKRAIGRPVDGTVTITTASLRGISLYEPNELVMSARAGTPLSQIEAELAARGQMLPFEPIDLGAGDRRPAGHADHRRGVRHQHVGRPPRPVRRRARPPARRQRRQRPRRAVPGRRPRDEERDRLRRLARPGGQLGHARGDDRGDVQGHPVAGDGGDRDLSRAAGQSGHRAAVGTPWRSRSRCRAPCTCRRRSRRGSTTPASSR